MGPFGVVERHPVANDTVRLEAVGQIFDETGVVAEL